MLAATIASAGCDGSEDEPVAPPPVRDPAKAKGLAERYQPSLEISRDDGFWPVSVLTVDRLSWNGAVPCFAPEKSAKCKPPAPVNQLPWNSGPEDAYIDYPADSDVGEQRESVRQALRELQGGGESLLWGSRAQLYFFVSGRGRDNPISLQYWFYYPFNYLPLRIHGYPVWNTDLHEGDFEGLSILLSARAHRPVYVWMPRHTEEGERFVWNEGAALEHPEGHPVGYVAQGSHATYGSCGTKFRSVRREIEGESVPIPLPYDLIGCSASERHELVSTWPVVNIARTWWACWPGHFGYAPGHSQPRASIDADGPASPLFQQRFPPNSSRPCAGVDPPSASPGDREIVGSRETAEALGVRGGRLDGLFENCQDWSQRPAAGSYMVACDEATLSAFFDSGLESPGDQGLRIAPGGKPPAGPAVPAVFESRDTGGVDGAVIRTRRTAHPEIYVAIRDGGALRTAEFGALALGPGQRLQLRRPSGSEWKLVDLAEGGREVAHAKVQVSHAATPPARPAILSATRRGADVRLRFSGGTDPATQLLAIAGSSRQDLESGRRVGSVRGDPSGTYELTIPDPEREIRLLRVVAIRDASAVASTAAAVSEGG